MSYKSVCSDQVCLVIFISVLVFLCFLGEREEVRDGPDDLEDVGVDPQDNKPGSLTLYGRKKVVSSLVMHHSSTHCRRQTSAEWEVWEEEGQRGAQQEEAGIHPWE